jgi:hypothetical protein
MKTDPAAPERERPILRECPIHGTVYWKSFSSPSCEICSSGYLRLAVRVRFSFNRFFSSVSNSAV